MTTLFLDFDGTLHGWPVVRAFEHANALAEVLRPFDIDIVLTSNWVLKQGLAVATAQLPDALRALVTESVYGGLPVDSVARWNRAEVIERYLALPRWPTISRWVILDDTASIFADEERVIRCNPATGLTVRDLERLTQMLKKAER
jgi:hypothetical protein